MLLILRLLGCDGTPIWWRRAKFSSSTAARERKIKDRVARNVVREMSIGENYERNITPIHSDISRFSRGTILHGILRIGWVAKDCCQSAINQLAVVTSQLFESLQLTTLRLANQSSFRLL